MPTINVDRLVFTTSRTSTVTKYDDWGFYRNRFIKMRPGLKAVDLIVCEAQTAYFIEVKDYRRHARTKAIDLGDEVQQKVLDTLAAMLPAKCNAPERAEADFATQVAGCRRLRVILHLEQPAKHSRLFPRAFDPANLTLELRRKLKAVDAHPIVSSVASPGTVPWTVV